jgi:Putative phage metallopeptidase
MQYELSSEVAKVAERVIKQHHPDLYSKRIHYLMLDKKDDKGSSVSKKSKGHQVFAEIKVLSGDAAFLVSGEARTDDDGPKPIVVLKVYRMPWMNLKTETREALIDSQLCRLTYDDETGRPSIMEYDAKLFGANIAHYGTWNDEIERVLRAAKDLPLFEENGKPKTESDVKVIKPNGNGKAVEASAPEAPKTDLPPIQETVNQKRGRGKAARA